jgi:hypothetical protein
MSSTIPVRILLSEEGLAPYSVLQDRIFVCERLLEQNYFVVTCNALCECHRGIQAQRLVYNTFQVRESIQLLHGRGISWAGT